MAAEDKEILFKIKVEVDAANSALKQTKVEIQKNIQGFKDLTKGTQKYEAQQAKLVTLQNKLIVNTNKYTEALKKQKQAQSTVVQETQTMSRASGGAASSVLEFGRVLSDAPYGIRGVANNLSQLSSNLLFTSQQVDKVTGKVIGFGGVLKQAGQAMLGPLGILVAIQGLIALAEVFASKIGEASNQLGEFAADSVTSAVAKLTILKKAINDVNISLEDKKSLLKAASTEFKELEGYAVGTADGIDEITFALDGMISKMKEVAFAKAILEASQELMKELAKGLVKGAEGFGESFTGSLAVITDAVGVTVGAVNKKFTDGLLDTGGQINKLYDMLTKKQADGTGTLLELLFGADAKKNPKKPAKRVNKIFKEAIFSLQKEINQFIIENEKLSTRNAFELLAISQKAEREEIELKRTSFIKKNKVRYDNFIAQESARRKMTKEEFMQTKEGLQALETLNYDFAFANLEADEANAALKILQIQQTNELERKIQEKHDADMIKLRGKSSKMALKASGRINGTEAGSLGKPLSKTGAEGIDALVQAYEAAGVIEDSLFEEALAVKKQQLIDSGLAIEDVNKQIFELRYQNEIERVQREIDLEQMKIDAKKNINEEYVSWVSGLSNIFKTIAGENEALAKVGVVLEQGAAIASIVIRTQAANAKIKAEAAEQASVTSARGIASVAQGSMMSAAGNPMGTLLIGAGKTAIASSKGILASAATRVLKNNIGSGISIAKILATNLGSGSVGGGGGGDTGSGGESGGRTFDFNLVGNTGVNQLAQGIAGQFDQPIQAYVVASQMTSQQQMDATIQSNASIG